MSAQTANNQNKEAHFGIPRRNISQTVADVASETTFYKQQQEQTKK